MQKVQWGLQTALTPLGWETKETRGGRKGSVPARLHRIRGNCGRPPIDAEFALVGLCLAIY